MLNLIIAQLMAVLKQHGFDGEKAQAQIGEAIADLRAMKESQDRCEAMLRQICIAQERVTTENHTPLLYGQ